MQRRRFLLAACAVVAVSAIPAVSSAASSGRRLVADRAFKVGDRVRCENGTVLVVSEVTAGRSDARCYQYDVCFSHVDGSALAEGSHVLHGSAGVSNVFMQPTASGLRAHFSHLI